MKLRRSHHLFGFPRTDLTVSATLVFLLFSLWSSLAGAVIEPDLINGGKVLYLAGRDTDWQMIAPPFDGARIYQLLPDADQPRRFYAATGAGLFVSQDHGRHWTPVDLWSPSLPGDRRESLDREVFALAQASGIWFAATRRGLLVSRDERQHWEKVDGRLPTDMVPLTVSVAPSDPNLLYLGAAGRGVFRSQDGGQSWRAVSDGLPPALGASPLTPIHWLVIDPTNSQIVYAGTEVDGLYVTRDGGQSWRPANEGLPGLSPYRTFPPLLVLDPTDPSVLYTVIGYPVHSHRIETLLYKSTDHAQWWEAVAILPENIPFHSLSFSRETPHNLLIGYEDGVLEYVDDRRARSDAGDNDRLRGPGQAPSIVSRSLQTAPDFDVGQIAVLQDDGTLMHLFDLHNRSIQFVPVDDRTYRASFIPMAFDATPGQRLTLGDDDFDAVGIPFAFRIYNRDRSQVFVNSNGNLTFNRGSRDATPSLGGLVARISAFWSDLDPSQGGSVTVSSGSDRLVITWTNVPEVNSGARNTFQVILFNDGRIIISFLDVQSQVGLTGVTPGTLLPIPVDLTEDLPVPARRGIQEFFDGAFEIEAIGHRFYQTHPDEFDLLTVYGASAIPHDVVGGGFAFFVPLQNEIRGIGRSQGEFNGGPGAFGSDGRLQGFLNMNKLNQYPDDPSQTFLGTNSTLDVLAQEFGHRWLAFVDFIDGGMGSSALLGRDFSHWSFFMDSDASEMEGNRWIDNGNGTFTSVEATSRYSLLDRYLMGLAASGEVPPLFLITNPGDTFGRTSSSAPEVGVIVTGSRKNVVVNQIVQAEGARFPPYPLAPNRFTQAFILILPQGSAISPADVDKLETIRQNWQTFFRLITGGRATVDTRLTETTGPDLTPVSLSLSPSTVAAGASLKINLVIANQGTAVAGSASHEIRLSEDSLIDSNDVLLATLATNPLSAGSSASFSLSVAIPSGTPAGQKFIGIVADAGNAVVEINETNNLATASITVSGSGAGADLRPLNFTVSPSTVPVGGSLTISVTILNQGTAVAPQASHEIRLSNDSLIDAGDTFLTGFTTAALPPGASIVFSIGTTIPANTPPGGKFVGLMVDATNQAAESDETNNTVSVFINVTNPVRER